MANQIQFFLETLFSGALSENPDLKAALWTKSDNNIKQTFQSNDLKTLTEIAEKCGKKHDVYAAVGLSTTLVPRFSRPTADMINAICDLWIDIDIAGPGHKKPLPASLEEAVAFAEELIPGIRPSFTIFSGGGIQARFLLEKPWHFNNEQARKGVEDLLGIWKAYCITKGAAKGWSIDSVWDLARIMRLPGTWNIKKAYGEPRQAFIMTEHSDPSSKISEPGKLLRSLADKEGLLANSSLIEFSKAKPNANATIHVVQTDAKVKTVGYAPTFEMKADLDFSEKVEALIENDDKFKKLWLKKKDRSSDLDNSLSSFEMALANHMVRIDMKDQEIIDALRYWRKKHATTDKEREKVNRREYYEMTIRKARAADQRRQAFKALVTLQERAKDANEDLPEDEAAEPDKKQLLEFINMIFGSRITKIRKLMSSPAEYEIVSPKGSKKVGDMNAVLNQRRFNAAYAELADDVLPTFKQKDWDRIAKAIVQAAEHVEVAYETTNVGFVETLLTHYLTQNRPLDNESSFLVNNRPFMKDGQIMFNLRNFANWASMNGDKLNLRELGIVLIDLGIKHGKFTIRSNGESAQVQLYMLPKEQRYVNIADREQ